MFGKSSYMNQFLFKHSFQDLTMEDSNELKAGHPPAQKVGGMRVVQHKHKDEKPDASPSKMTEEEREEFGDDKPMKAANV